MALAIDIPRTVCSKCGQVLFMESCKTDEDSAHIHLIHPDTLGRCSLELKHFTRIVKLVTIFERLCPHGEEG